MPQFRKLEITMTLEVDLQFLVDHPCTKDWFGLFGGLDRARLIYLISVQDPLLGKMLEEIARFFLDEDAHRSGASDDAKANGDLVAEGQRKKGVLRRYCRQKGYL